MKKATIILIATLFITSLSSIFSSVSSNAVSFVNVTPAEQRLSGERDYGTWSVGWGGGYNPYMLTFREDTSGPTITLLRGYSGTSYRYTHLYTLPTDVGLKEWNSTFRVIDDFGATRSHKVKATQYRYF